MRLILFLLTGIIICSINSPSFAQKSTILEPEMIKKGHFDKSARYAQYQGRRIREINIIVLKPFGRKVTDTTFAGTNLIVRAGNKLHANTHNFVIENIILIHEGELFDPLATRESERLIRQAAFVKDTRTIITEIGNNQVDVTFVVADL